MRFENKAGAGWRQECLLNCREIWRGDGECCVHPGSSVNDPSSLGLSTDLGITITG